MNILINNNKTKIVLFTKVNTKPTFSFEFNFKLFQVGT